MKYNEGYSELTLERTQREFNTLVARVFPVLQGQLKRNRRIALPPE